jgi:hypothetical protein
MKTIAQEWDQLDRIVLHEDDSPAFKLEMKRSFYSGAFVVLLGEKEIAQMDIPYEEAVKLIQARHAEVEAFFTETFRNAGQTTRE